MYKVSLCTVCMNRLHHLKETLSENISNNFEYENIEYVLLDYNSSDEIETYIRDNFQEQIESHKFIYYKTKNPKYFNRSHSRNVAMKLATGDIICNIDADNYTGKDFASYVNNFFESKSQGFLTTIYPKNSKGVTLRDSAGRICLKKTDFIRIHGFDERMIDYGFEDYDLINRLEILGLKRTIITDEFFLRAISHPHDERISNEFGKMNLLMILISYISVTKSDLIFIFNNNKFIKTTIKSGINNSHLAKTIVLSNVEREYILVQDLFFRGSWSKNDNKYQFSSSNGKYWDCNFEKKERCFILTDSETTNRYYEIKSRSIQNNILFMYNQLFNKAIMKENEIELRSKVNEQGFGSETVYKNFDYTTAINL